jgi:2-polyprenyl-3-methyl-5-hydroxy-6-metoxy-1,4-benzoquinol methylase
VAALQLPADPIDVCQRYMRSAAHLLRRGGALPADDPPRRCLEGSERERHFEKGQEQIATLAAELEAHTGCTLERRRALDFGCGFGRLALPLAARCAHVYGLDVSTAALEEADRNARLMNVDNVEWLAADRLDELTGRYDLVLSHWVFPHIPSREGERTFAALLAGLRPGGLGAIHVTVRPSRPLAGLLRRLEPGYPYLLMNSYSLNRLGELLDQAGVNRWQVKWHGRRSPQASTQPLQSATITFHKSG